MKAGKVPLSIPHLQLNIAKRRCEFRILIKFLKVFAEQTYSY